MADITLKGLAALVEHGVAAFGTPRMVKIRLSMRMMACPLLLDLAASVLLTVDGREWPKKLTRFRACGC